MNKTIVTTTINPPTEAIEKLDEKKDWTLVVVGDKKTPKDYKLQKGTYLSPDDQEKINIELSDLIGWNCIQRRNFGFIYAYMIGADIIATIDDDNIPYDYWGEDLLLDKEVETNFFETNAEVFDPVKVALGKNLIDALGDYKRIWHRGFPIQLLHRKYKSTKKKKVVKCDIQADFWNGEPDVDAVCRIVNGPFDISFPDENFPIASNTFSPFNSQNTFLTRDIIPDYFMFPHVGRMDDIWASYYVQSLGYKVVYNKPSVYQKRNHHSLLKDMRKEMLGYRYNLDLAKSLKENSNSINYFIPPKAALAFKKYRECFE